MELEQRTYDKIIAHAWSMPNREVTGYVERWDPLRHQGREELERATAMRNASPTPETDYAWTPEAMRLHWDAMDRCGSEPVAIYHSHPGGKRSPSEVDMTAAMMVDMCYLIVFPKQEGRTAREWDITAWRCIERGILVAEPLVVS